MKDNKIDKLFQEKLSSLEKSPPSMAWDKIDAQLHKGKTPFLLWHKAAIITIFCLSGTLIFSLANRTPHKQEVTTTATTRDSLGQVHQNMVDKNNHVQERIASLDNKGMAIDSSTNKEAHIGSGKHTSTIALAAKSPATKLPKESEAVTRTLNVKANLEQGVNPIDVHPTSEDLPKVEEEALAQVAETKKASFVTIEFKAGKKVPEAANVAHTDMPKSASPLRKLTEKFKEIKYTDIDLGNLRQAKDDLLAFDSNRDDGKTSEK